MSILISKSELNNRFIKENVNVVAVYAYEAAIKGKNLVEYYLTR